MTNYPTDQLLYWKHICDLPLQDSVIKYLNGESLLGIELSPIKDYIAYWVNFEGHVFEDESDRQHLLMDLENCKDVGNLNLIIHNLLDFGIDPF